MVQAQGPRREHRPRPRVARARAPPAGPDVDRGGRRRTDRRGRAALQLRLGRRLLRGDRLWRDRCAVGGHAPGRRRRRPEHAADRRPARADARTGGVRVKGVGDLLVRFAKCCHPIPGDPIVGFITRGKGVTVHLQSCPTVVNEREVEPAHRGRVGGRADRRPTRSPSGSRPTTGPGLLSDITQVVAENKVNILAAHVGVTPDHTAVVTATLQVALGLAAGQGHGPDRAAQGRHQRPARPRLTARPGGPRPRCASTPSH